ncbi:zinc-dependent alcohol dehydrogenase family protein [Bradyrhizobium sp. dw_411]|uniref:zinc-dependent alcohol dehydrogenase family protein n=1 Tax=Bradyrhizobium sp. dw_411 TaxID=2720082 RepID=UPI001BCAF2AD|nr:zinc-dependent alcohol dehydrogenase family protein [Bradyrhizobium sp. dw_411]
MKAIQIEGFGNPADVVKVVDLPDVDAPGIGEVVIALEASPINPSDLLMISGRYGYLPKLPSVVGQEGVGRITAVGNGVTHLKIGDRTIVPYPAPVWAERIKADARWLRRLPDGDVDQLAMLGINPPTAYLLLTDFVKLPMGSWVIQNAANSGVGRSVIPIAKSLGLNTVSVVRRDDVVDEIKALGGDVVLVDGPDLAKRVASATGDALISLALDGVGDMSTMNLLGCLADKARLVAYSAMSGKPFVGDARLLIYREMTLHGFWLGHWFKRTTPQDYVQMYERLAPLVVSGAIRTPVAQTFTFDQASEAVKAAARYQGKILFKTA